MRIWIFVVLCFFFSCKEKKRNDLITSSRVHENQSGVVQQRAGASLLLSHLPCNTDNQLRYSIYYPSSFPEGLTFPVLMLFDPHADGDLPLNLYRDLADKYKIILISSCDSKNGNSAEFTAGIIQTMMAELSFIEKADTSLVFTGGFSGGARVAAMLGLSPAGIAAVISCGAGLPEGSWKGVPPHLVVAMAGDRDMNLREVLRFKSPDSRIQTRYQVIRFEGEHAWPPSEIMEQAIISCLSISQRDHLTKKDQPLLEKMMTTMKQSVRGEENPVFKRAAYLCYLKNFKDLGDVNKEMEEMAALENSSVYKQMVIEESRMFDEEERIRNNYYQAIGTRDTVWWQQQLAAVLDTSTFLNQPLRRAMLKRVQGNFSLVFYMSLQRALAALEKDQQLYFSSLYRKVDPKNPEAWYLAAVVAANRGSLSSAKDYLSTAFKTGFKDVERCKKEQAFFPLLSDYGFQSILNPSIH